MVCREEFSVFLSFKDLYFYYSGSLHLLGATHTHTHLSAGGLFNYLIAVIYHQSNKDMVFQMIGSDLVYINALRVKVVSIQKKKER